MKGFDPNPYNPHPQVVLSLLLEERGFAEAAAEADEAASSAGVAAPFFGALVALGASPEVGPWGGPRGLWGLLNIVEAEYNTRRLRT